MELNSSGLSLREAFPTCRWVFPSSQTRYSTVFQEDLQEWFDVYSLTDPTVDSNLQIEGLRASFGFIRDLIYEEAELLPDKRIILLGLSQGCAMGMSDSNFLFEIDSYLICWHQWVLSTLGNAPLSIREPFFNTPTIIPEDVALPLGYQ